MSRHMHLEVPVAAREEGGARESDWWSRAERLMLISSVKVNQSHVQSH
jgi:hypothetical protein